MSGTGHLRLILASASPRRRSLLMHLGVPFDVIPSTVDETIPTAISDPGAIAEELARQKVADVASRHQGRAVLAADTIVVDGAQILGKPTDAGEATAMLRRLRDRAHQVITGVAVAYGGTILVRSVATGVIMRVYTDDEIAAYIASGDPFDKAGSYAIQHPGFRPVSRIDGCYCNVVGLPVSHSATMLMELGVPLGMTQPVTMPDECPVCSGWTPPPSE